MLIPRTQLEGRIPHAGRMFLLDGVLEFDESRIVCAASSHRSADHPMRAQGRLGAAAAIEYASQAMASHGALLSADRAPPRAGFLVALREVRLMCERLDDIEADLRIEATRVMGDETRVIYQFSVSAAHATLVHGRATVVLEAGAHL